MEGGDPSPDPVRETQILASSGVAGEGIEWFMMMLPTRGLGDDFSPRAVETSTYFKVLYSAVFTCGMTPDAH